MLTSWIYITKYMFHGFMKQNLKSHSQGIIQSVFKIGNPFWVHQNSCPNFDRLAKTKTT